MRILKPKVAGFVWMRMKLEQQNTQNVAQKYQIHLQPNRKSIDTKLRITIIHEVQFKRD